MSARPPYFVMADADPLAWIDAGLDVDHLGLHLLAWAESSTHALDGRIPGLRLRRLPGWTQRRQDRLVARGVWILDEALDEILVADYLTLNRSRAEIMAVRSSRQNAGRQGGEATAARLQRNPDGTYRVARG